MTKEDPDKLCPSCANFDYKMNREGGSSSDVFVQCDHDLNEDEVKDDELLRDK